MTSRQNFVKIYTLAQNLFNILIFISFNSSNSIKWFLLTLILSAKAETATAQSTSDFLVQEICANSSNIGVYGDPYSCPVGTTARKLNVGEALPYHKIDVNGAQISDSFPISDRNGISISVQTYFFPGASQDNDWTSGNVHFQPLDGGYNIIGADTGGYVFFRGTWDGGGGWQPWWNSSGDAKGWILFPNTSISGFGYGNAASLATDNWPEQNTSAGGSANVEWNIGTFTFESGKAIQAVYDFRWGESTHDHVEVNYFTQIYGVTRYEAWTSSNYASGPGAAASANCPHATTTATTQGHTIYMQDCRDWTQIAAQPSTPWNPGGTADYDSNVLTWPIDPLYNSTNILQNAHFQSSPVTQNPSSCDITNWNRSYTSPVTNWGWDTSAAAPMHGTGSYNCVLQFSVPAAPNGNVVYQQQSVGSLSGTYTYGVELWSPGYNSTVYVNLIGRDSSGNLTDNYGFTASTGNMPRTFSGNFSINSSTRTLFLALYPQDANVPYDFDGAWIAQAP